MIDASFRPKALSIRLFAILGLAAIAALSACTPPPPPPPKVVAPPAPVAGNPLDKDLPTYFRLPNTPPGSTPVRVGIILPFSSTTPGTRNLAAAMLKSAELALFDGGNSNVLLITADEGAGPDTAGAAAVKLMGQGAEIIIGPLFGPSVAAVAPLARDRGIPVLAFSTERSVAGNGIYLLSFLPQSEVKRVVNYAVSQGHHNFAAMVPQTPYGRRHGGGHRTLHAQFQQRDGAVRCDRKEQRRCGDDCAGRQRAARHCAVAGLQWA
jgi:branched-chain amino acid transport system substrate-binding protein